MASMNPSFKDKSSFKGRQFRENQTKGHSSGVGKKKRKWIPANKFFVGSVQEGHGFALKRKEKTKQQYQKLQRKQRHTSQQQEKPMYPEHLQHLYMAEQQRLDAEEEENRRRRRKAKTGGSGEEEAMTQTADDSRPVTAGSSNENLQSSQTESSHKGTLVQRKQKKLSSFQKTKQEYERIKEEREKKREEYLKNKAQREEALKRYKDKKMATYQLLKKKTKKGQPNLNLQMELLLQKIQTQQK